MWKYKSAWKAEEKQKILFSVRLLLLPFMYTQHDSAFRFLIPTQHYVAVWHSYLSTKTFEKNHITSFTMKA